MNRLILAGIATATAGSSGTFVGMERMNSRRMGQINDMKRQSEDRTIGFTKEKLRLNKETEEHQNRYKALTDSKSRPLIGYLAQAAGRLKNEGRTSMSMCKLNDDRKGIRFCSNIVVQPEALTRLYNYKEPKEKVEETPI